MEAAPPRLSNIQPSPVTKPAAADRVLAEAIYRAMRMIAAAVRVRYGVVITVEMGGLLTER